MLKLRFGVVVAILFGVMSSAFADSGLYVGINVGYGTINTTTTNGFEYLDGSSTKNGGSALGGLMLGYDFNRYVGVQADYDYIANVEYTSGSSTSGVSGSFSANQQILDVGIVGHLPFGLFSNSLNGLSIFGKLAMGYTFTSFSGGTVEIPDGSNLQVSLPGTSSSLVPVVGAGVEYGVNSVGVRLEYDYVGNTAIVNNSQTLMNVNDSLVLLSVLYHF